MAEFSHRQSTEEQTKNEFIIKWLMSLKPNEYSNVESPPMIMMYKINKTTSEVVAGPVSSSLPAASSLDLGESESRVASMEESGAMSLDVPGAATLLDVPGAATLDVPGAATLLDVPGAATLDVPGAATLLDVPGAATLLDVPGAATLLDVPGAATLDVSEVATLDVSEVATLDVSEAATLDVSEVATLDVSGAATLDISGSASLWDISGAASLEASAALSFDVLGPVPWPLDAPRKMSQDTMDVPLAEASRECIPPSSESLLRASSSLKNSFSFEYDASVSSTESSSDSLEEKCSGKIIVDRLFAQRQMLKKVNLHPRLKHRGRGFLMKNMTLKKK